MTGLEYVLLHVQEPILYVIRKQHRHSPQQATVLADYYIIAGVVYQAPDLANVLNSRLVNKSVKLLSLVLCVLFLVVGSAPSPVVLRRGFQFREVSSEQGLFMGLQIAEAKRGQSKEGREA